MICDVVKFYEGGLSFEFAYKLTFNALNKLKIEGSRINIEIKKMSGK